MLIRPLFTYFMLIIISMFRTPSGLFHRSLLLVWLAYVWIWLPRHTLCNKPQPLWKLGLASVVLQAPALMAGLVSLEDAMAGYDNEWASGLLQFWMLPYLPWLELLPHWYLSNISGTFVITCLLAPLMAVLTTLIWITIGFAPRHGHMGNQDLRQEPAIYTEPNDEIANYREPGKVKARSSSKRQKAR